MDILVGLIITFSVEEESLPSRLLFLDNVFSLDSTLWFSTISIFLLCSVYLSILFSNTFSEGDSALMDNLLFNVSNKAEILNPAESFSKICAPFFNLSQTTDPLTLPPFLSVIIFV